jgi:hypothetical protein
MTAMTAPGGMTSRSSRWAVVAGAVALTVGSIGAGGAWAQDSTPPGFSDGSWVGEVHYRGVLSGADVSATGQFDTATFTVDWAGGVPTGVFDASGHGDSTVGGGEGTGSLDIVYHGSITGSPTAPAVAGESAAISGSVTVNGITVPISLDLGAADLGPFPLDVLAANCDTVSGDLTTVIAMANAQLGGAATLTAMVGSWVAVRQGATDPAGGTDVLMTLIADADAVADSAAAGTLDRAGLVDVVYRAEQFANATNRNAACGAGETAVISTAITSIVQRMLDTMLANPAGFAPTDWGDVVRAAVASGVVGAGSGPSGADYVTQLAGVLESLLADPSIDLVGAISVMWAAQSLGLADIAQSARDLIDTL